MNSNIQSLCQGGVINIERIRPLLNAALSTKWPQLAPRPLDNEARPMPDVGYLVDATTTECFKPKGRFGEVKHYFDGHKFVYGIKTEIVVTSARPHVAVFVSKHYPGSVSDYTIHCENFHHYSTLLAKTGDERLWNGDDGRHASWGLLGDKMYTGPAADTPGERRIVPVKGSSLTADQKKANKQKARTRNPVEQYLGRLIMKNAILFNVYRYDHSNFDLDFENCCMLVNEDISIRELTLKDGEFYQKYLDARVERWKAQQAKLKAGRKKYEENKKGFLAKVQKWVKE